MPQIKKWNPVQEAAMEKYQKIGADFPVGVHFQFNLETLGGTFYCNGTTTPIANPQQLADVWKEYKASASTSKRRQKKIVNTNNLTE